MNVDKCEKYIGRQREKQLITASRLYRIFRFNFSQHFVDLILHFTVQYTGSSIVEVYIYCVYLSIRIIYFRIIQAASSQPLTSLVSFCRPDYHTLDSV